MEAVSLLGAAAKTTLAGLSVGSAYHLLARTPLMQRIRIRRSLREQAGRLGALAHERAADWEHFPRAAVRRRLVDALKAPPVGPIVLTGPQGAGTSAIAEAAIARSGTPLLLHINLREQAASSHRPLFWQLVRNSGYYFMSREWADIGLGRFTGVEA